MQHEFTAIVERDAEWFVAYAPEVPGANGQGRTREEALASLAEAIGLVLEDQCEEGFRGVPAEMGSANARDAGLDWRLGVPSSSSVIAVPLLVSAFLFL